MFFYEQRCIIWIPNFQSSYFIRDIFIRKIYSFSWCKVWNKGTHYYEGWHHVSSCKFIKCSVRNISFFTPGFQFFFLKVNPVIFSERKSLLLVLTFFHISIHLFFLHISYINHLLKLVLNS